MDRALLLCRALPEIGDSTNAIFIPAVCARPRMVVREISLRFAGCPVILAHGTPCALAEVWSPKVPALAEALIPRDTSLLSVHANAVQSYLGVQAKLLFCDA